MEDPNKKEKEQKSTSTPLSFGDIFVNDALEVVAKASTPVVDFLMDKLQLAGETAVEVAGKLPKAVVEQIESFDGENLNKVASSVVDAVKSIELPNVDVSGIDFPDIDIDIF